MSRHKRKGRGIDHLWRFVKFRGDAAFYAKCSCGFRYGCYKNHSIKQPFPIEPDPEKLYPYCPLCGSKKTRYIADIELIDKYPWE